MIPVMSSVEAARSRTIKQNSIRSTQAGRHEMCKLTTFACGQGCLTSHSTCKYFLQGSRYAPQWSPAGQAEIFEVPTRP